MLRGPAGPEHIGRPGSSYRATARGLAAYIAAGSIAAAAYELGISETTARQHLSGLYRRTGCLNAAQAAYMLGACGSVTLAPRDARNR
jgi:DNA-binding CsgD family transcriptional regulator